MERAALSSILLQAPAWARVGLTVRDERLRERAADALAATIIERLEPAPARHVRCSACGRRDSALKAVPDRPTADDPFPRSEQEWKLFERRLRD